MLKTIGNGQINSVEKISGVRARPRALVCVCVCLCMHVCVGVGMRVAENDVKRYACKFDVIKLKLSLKMYIYTTLR